jgi:hypothetical protein
MQPWRWLSSPGSPAILLGAMLWGTSGFASHPLGWFAFSGLAKTFYCFYAASLSKAKRMPNLIFEGEMSVESNKK